MREWPAANMAAARAVELLDSADAYVASAIALEGMGDVQHALLAYQSALVRDTAHVVALTNRGAALLALGRLDEAIVNNQNLVVLYPSLFQGWFNLGDALLKADENALAEDAFERALKLRVNDPRTLVCCAFVCALQTKFEKAQKLLDLASGLAPALVLAYIEGMSLSRYVGKDLRIDARTLYLFAHFDRLEQCDWVGREGFADTFIRLAEDCSDGPADLPLGFRAMVMGLPDTSQYQLARKIAAKIRSSFDTSISPIEPKVGERQHRKIRVGYVSPDLRTHPVGLLTKDLFHVYDRERFEIFCYSLSDRACRDDAISCSISQAVDVWRDIADLDELAAAACIAHDGVDILVDMCGYTDGCRPGIFACRPAPLQISWVGYLATTGMDCMDYVVLDSSVAPLDQSIAFTEKVVRLPATLFPCSFAHSSLVNMDRGALGLSEDCLVLAAFHNPFKIDPEVFAVWMRLLKAHPGAVLWLLRGTPVYQDNLRGAALEHGVAPSRLVFAERITHHEHLSRLACADLFLDTLVCNGATTVCDALSAGIPVITCKGDTVAQRMASGILLAAGFSDGIAESVGEYEQKALAWLESPKSLGVLRERLRLAKQDALFFDVKRWVQGFEAALIKIWERYTDGLHPEDITIEDCVTLSPDTTPHTKPAETAVSALSPRSARP